MSASAANSSLSIGSLLAQTGKLTAAAIDTIAHRHNPHQEKLGWRLWQSRLIHGKDLYEGLAAQHGYPFIDLEQKPCDPELLVIDDVPSYSHHLAVPWRKEGETLIIACAEVTPATKEWAHHTFGSAITFAICTPRDLYRAIDHVLGEPLEKYARFMLHRHLPMVSSYATLTTGQRLTFGALFFIFMISLWLAPSITATASLAIMNVFYLSNILFKGWLFLVGLTRRKWRHHCKAPIVDETSLPTYSILIPLHREANGIAPMLQAMNALDYPSEKLDIKLILEADDQETYDAIVAERPGPHYYIIRVPAHSELRTKPRACNYALPFVRGDILTIYDAEDRPEPLQLKRVVELFEKEGDEIGCIQAKLNYYNRSEHWLAQMFAIEYSQLFDMYLPALQQMNVPIPLGGTSNHIHVKRLRSVGGWDPFNVTEDADLGVRLHLLGLKTRVLESVTLEEAPITIRAWLNQRSRWIKGHMQTWIVYMRQPLRIYRAFGAKGFWGFQLFLGAPPLIYLTAPFMWMVGLAWALGMIPEGIFPNWLIFMNLMVLLAGLGGHLWQALMTLRLRRWSDMTRAALTYPLYWFLHSVASFKALWQLITRPHFWEKTDHGRTEFKEFQWPQGNSSS